MIIQIVRDGLRIFCVVTLILSIFTIASYTFALDSKADWNEYKSTHFIIYYHSNIPNNYVREFSQKCERYYHSITERLNFSRFNFWLWEERAKIFIYKDRQDYIKDTSSPEWSEASVYIRKKIINTYYFEEDFFDTILPHELTHIILREFIGLKRRIPLWFEEGVACANEKDSYSKYLLLAKTFVEKGTYIAVPEIERTNERKVVFPSLFYPTAASLVIFLLEDYNREYFAQLCRELRDADSFYGAMNKVYGIKDAEDLNEKFLIFLRNKN